MDAFTNHDLQTLIKNPQPPCISVYMPMHRTMPDAQQNPVRFRNLIHEAERQLNHNGFSKPLSLNLRQARNLLNETDFWLHPADGLAVFLSANQFEAYRLPWVLPERVVITSQFHTKPLLPMLSGNQRFLVITLSQNDVRVFECMRQGCRPLEVKNLPRSRKEVLKYDVLEKQVQLHTFNAPSGGQRMGVQHGHGSSTDESKEFQTRFCREVARALYDRFKYDRAPLVLAAVDYLHPIFHDVNQYPFLLDEGIIGNPELWNAEELHRQAWPIAEAHLRRQRDEAARRYEELKAVKRSTHDLKTIVSAANYGRVDTLFVAVSVEKWGRFDEAANNVELRDPAQAGDVELLDYAAAQTLLNDGTVYAEQPAMVPDGEPMAAILRY